MKALNFYSPSTELMAGMAANIKPGITDKEFLELEIKKWLTSKTRLRQIEGDKYYEGEQVILARKRTVINESGDLDEVKNLPNNRIVDNQYAKMVDQKANYLCGQPITFDTKNATYGAALTEVFGKKAQRTLRIVAEKALTGGKAWISKQNAGRVVMTESAYFSSAAQKDCFNELGVEQYRVVGTLDRSTCGLCGDMDGKVFKMSEYQEGSTAPPFHPWCRCCTAPYFEDMEGIGERYARDAVTGERYKLPKDTTYKQWKAMQDAAYGSGSFLKTVEVTEKM